MMFKGWCCCRWSFRSNFSTIDSGTLYFGSFLDVYSPIAEESIIDCPRFPTVMDMRRAMDSMQSIYLTAKRRRTTTTSNQWCDEFQKLTQTYTTSNYIAISDVVLNGARQEASTTNSMPNADHIFEPDRTVVQYINSI